MDGVTLEIMTRELCHELFRGFERDPDTYMDMSLFAPFEYDRERVERYFDSQQRPDRLLFAVMLQGKPVGEVKLKDIDLDAGECTLAIHLQNDSVKGRGIGTRAERLAVGYAFTVLGVRRVLADTVLKNTRSAHILDSLGFHFLREEDIFRYFALDRNDFRG